ncbi:hypothetical protein [Brunnivagina elsteri]|uniref:Uncharacterized protein n=1 Tax=Brunnivagina elsteri CCALA 953 TaxID=987040 RepID=A0A2A2TLH9_9CYAN|nr:hypothetical protein [Calothrix elsteri]PAX58335.1 hypothetical protein CK510_07890 [Calothrix elsteri CCALA 953]
MKLVIREYLSMLKESGEIDALLPDLLLAMGIDLLSRPAIGSRQFGVDIPAVGIDPKDNRQKLFLLTVKKGDINRNSWNGDKNAVRQSLDEILDSYLRNRVRPEHEALPKKIILATGGELKQDVEPDWVNYVHRHAGSDPKYGEVEFDFWGADQLTLLIEQYLLDEYLFPESVQKYLRKTIALADQNEDEPRYFYKLIEEILFQGNLTKDKSKSAERKRQKALCLLDLSLNIVFYWCQEADNLKPALLCAERTVLLTWDWMRQNELFNCKTTNEKFHHLLSTYLKVSSAYASKLQPHCFVKDGLFGYGADELEYPLRTFEVIGILGTLGMVFINLLAITDNEGLRESYSKQMRAVGEMLAALVANNPSAFVPLHDFHSIDINLGLLTLASAGCTNVAAHWVTELGSRIFLAYKTGKYFPIASDRYDDLIAIEVGQAPPKEKLMEVSTLLPTLAGWFAVLNLADEYKPFQEAITKTFATTNFQFWFPDEETDKYLYKTNAGYESGTTLSSIQLPKTLDDFKTYIFRLHEKQEEVFSNLSCVNGGWFVLGLIASRHFRTPIIPGYWQNYVCEQDINEEQIPEEQSHNLE